MTATDVFERNFELHQLPGTLRLRNLDWGIYFTLDGCKTAGELRTLFRLEETAMTEVFTRLLHMDLIREKKLNLQEHIQAVALQTDTSDSRVKDLGEFIRSSSSPTKTLVPAQPQPAAIVKYEKPAAAFIPLPVPTPAKTMSLLSVIRFILEQNRDKTSGQLAVYRVFMGVDTKLLKKNGIHTLRFQDDRLITDGELQKAIEENVSKALRKNLPQEVFLRS